MQNRVLIIQAQKDLSITECLHELYLVDEAIVLWVSKLFTTFFELQNVDALDVMRDHSFRVNMNRGSIISILIVWRAATVLAHIACISSI